MGPAFRNFIIASVIFSIGNSSDTFLIMRAKDLGMSSVLTILAYVLYNVSRSFLSTPFGVISDKLPRRNVLIGGYLVFAVVYAAFGMVRSSFAVWWLFAAYGFYMAMTDGVGKALVSDMVPRERRGTALGAYHFILGVCAFFASVIAGILWTRFGVRYPFLFGAFMAAAGCVAFVILVRPSRQHVVN